MIILHWHQGLKCSSSLCEKVWRQPPIEYCSHPADEVLQRTELPACHSVSIGDSGHAQCAHDTLSMMEVLNRLSAITVTAGHAEGEVSVRHWVGCDQ